MSYVRTDVATLCHQLLSGDSPKSQQTLKNYVSFWWKSCVPTDITISCRQSLVTVVCPNRRHNIMTSVSGDYSISQLTSQHRDVSLWWQKCVPTDNIMPSVFGDSSMSQQTSKHHDVSLWWQKYVPSDDTTLWRQPLVIIVWANRPYNIISSASGHGLVSQQMLRW